MNFILRQLQQQQDKCFAVTSIGIDGETTDQVTQTAKPEIEVYEGMLFVTSEKHYKEKRLTAEVLNVSTERTSLGRLVTARAISSGKVILSGPSDTHLLKSFIEELNRWGVDTVFVDGALSRLSPGSPAITEAMVLSTGVAIARTIPELVRKTKFTYDLICIEAVDPDIKESLEDKDSGVWAVGEDGEIHDLNIPSLLLWEQYKDDIFRFGTTIYVSGIVSDNFLQFLRMQKQIQDIVLIVKDFTRIFVSPESYRAYLKRGGQIKVLWKTQLLSVCINPVSPEGYRLDSDELRVAMQDSLGIPVYDVRKLEEA